MSREIYIPPGGPPRVPKPSGEIYASMKEAGVFRMLADFYRRLGQSRIRHLFLDGEEALLDASEKSATFFVQITGGPPLFTRKYGPPKMRCGSATCLSRLTTEPGRRGCAASARF